MLSHDIDLQNEVMLCNANFADSWKLRYFKRSEKAISDGTGPLSLEVYRSARNTIWARVNITNVCFQSCWIDCINCGGIGGGNGHIISVGSTGSTSTSAKASRTRCRTSCRTHRGPELREQRPAAPCRADWRLRSQPTGWNLVSVSPINVALVPTSSRYTLKLNHTHETTYRACSLYSCKQQTCHCMDKLNWLISFTF